MKQNEPAKEKAKKARVGDVITLEGQEDGSKVAVRLLKVIDPASGGEFDEAGSGKRYVGVRLRLSNQGTTTYDDSPSNGATLIVSGDEQAESTLLHRAMWQSVRIKREDQPGYEAGFSSRFGGEVHRWGSGIVMPAAQR